MKSKNKYLINENKIILYREIKKYLPKKNLFLYRKQKSNFLLFALIIINIISLTFSKKSGIKRKINYLATDSEVTIRIYGKGTQQLLNNNFKSIPYSLEINSVPYIFNYTIDNLKYENNVILMKFNNEITSCENMFSGSINITQIDMTKFDFSQVTSMKRMFYENKNLLKIKLNTTIKISTIENLESIFEGCSLLESIDLSLFDTSKVTIMASMFKECNKLNYLQIYNFNTSLVRDMQYMFYGCGSLISLYLNNFDTSLVTNMGNMFNHCYKIRSLDLINFNTNLVSDLNYMFSNCHSLSYLDLSRFNTSLITNISGLFNGCINLNRLNLGSFNTNLVRDMSYLFNGCIELLQVDLSSFNTKLVQNMEFMFGSCNKLVSLNFNNFDTKSVSNMKFMFYQCNSIKILDLKSFQTPLVTNLEKMFSGCISLLSIDLSNFITSSVNNMNSIFSDCKSLNSLNILNFDISKVTDAQFMFFGCINLKSIDLSNFNTSSVNNMNSMFYNCYSLTSLDLSKFDTSKVENMQFMFFGCSKLKYLDIGNFDTSLVTNMNSMFGKCNELTSLNLYYFNTTLVNYMGSMFYSCTNLNYLNFYNFKENELLNAYDLFLRGTNNLKYCLFYENETNKILSEIKLINNINRQNIIIEKKQCIDKCENDDTYQYEYENICLIECPKTTVISKEDKFLCQSLVCDNYYNYEKTKCFDNIPDGYYLNNSEKKIIDKCHPDCRTCKEKETIDNTNCESCINSKYLDLGNCVSSCPNDNYYIEENNDILKCKCYYKEECSLCSLESLKNNSCLKCNNEDGYYPKEDEIINNNLYINCYKDLEGYYLDIANNVYRKCYSNCKSCSKSGDKKHNNCEECISGKTFINDFEEDYNCYEKCLYYYYLNQNNYYCTKNNECPKEHNKLILEKNKCIDNCINDNIYKFEYENICYKECPNGTAPILNNKNLCQLKCEGNLLYVDLINKKCLENCHPIDFFNKKCGLFNPNLKIQQFYINYIVNEIKNGNMNPVLNNNLIVKDKNIIYQIISLDNKNNDKNDISIIQLKKCEDILRNNYKIDKHKKIIMLKTEYYIDGLLIPIIDYILFNPENNEKLDLKNCTNENINIYIPVNINEKNLFKYDISNDYYNDICYPYTTDNGKDIIISDRKEEFNRNFYSICEKDCIFKEYNAQNKRVLCECKIKLESTILKNNNIDKNNLVYQFDNIKTSTSSVLKCYDTLFSNEGLEANIASYIIIFLFIVYTFQLCIWRRKINDFDINNKIKTTMNTIKNYNPPRMSIKLKSSTLYNDIKINKIQKTFVKKRTLQLKSNRSTNSENKELYNSILLKHQIEKEKEIFMINNMSDSELNSLPYLKAKKFDKRTFCKYYISLLKTKYILILSFCISIDYYSKYLNKCLLINSFSLLYFINTLFFTENIIHEIYIKNKFSIQISIIIYSTLISSIIISILKIISLNRVDTNKITGNSIKENEKNKKAIKFYNCKNTFIFLLMYFFLIFSWYYLSAFSAVYKNSQVYLLENVLICYAIFLIYPFILYLLPSFLRISSLSNDKKSSELIYNISKVIPLL